MGWGREVSVVDLKERGGVVVLLCLYTSILLGHVIVPIVAHAIANYMGFPDLVFIQQQMTSGQRIGNVRAIS